MKFPACFFGFHDFELQATNLSRSATELVATASPENRLQMAAVVVLMHHIAPHLFVVRICRKCGKMLYV
jgi:hypothetical protein